MVGSQRCLAVPATAAARIAREIARVSQIIHQEYPIWGWTMSADTQIDEAVVRLREGVSQKPLAALALAGAFGYVLALLIPNRSVCLFAGKEA